MNGKQIFDILSNTYETQQFFINVFAMDNIRLPPVNVFKQYFLIINTAPTSHVGKHWVAIFKPNVGKCMFIDSLGHVPRTYPKPIVQALTAISRETLFPNEFDKLHFRLQSYNSDLCGVYCIFIVYYLCTGVSLLNIMSWFKQYHTMSNDALILQWFKKKFHF